MNEKLQKLATKMVGLFKEGEFNSPQECFDLFKVIYKQQYDYFRQLSPDGIIKLVLYIYSLKNTGNFKLAEQILNKLGFASLFITQGNVYEISCDNCGGEGYYNCDNCDGNGNVECNTCDGEGRTEEEDNEWVDCDECGGNGEVYCDQCGGGGTQNCGECDGSGILETSELEYEYIVIATWNNDIKNACELRAGTLEPILSEYDIDTLRDNYIILGHQDDHAEFRSSIETNEYYCTNYEDEPDLNKSYSSELKIWTDDDKMNRYTL